MTIEIDYSLFNNWLFKNSCFFDIFYPKTFTDQYDLNQWISDREKAFLQLIQEFNLNIANLPRIKFFIFDSIQLAKISWFSCGFALLKSAEIFTKADQTIGHEIVHILVYQYKSGHLISSDLLHEGFATLYDHSYIDHDNLSKHELYANNYRLSLFTKIFIKRANSYYIAASFVKYLIIISSISNVLNLLTSDYLNINDAFIYYFSKTKYQLYKQWVLYLFN